MNISYNWLKKYIAADLSAEAMATILTDIGLEVESFEKIETVRGGLQGVVVGEVLTCEKHPDSDHLHVTTVDVGAPEPLRIVCGAPNCRKGLKVLPDAAEDGGDDQADIPGHLEHDGTVESAVSAQRVLTGSTDVEQAGLEGEGHGQTGHDEGCCIGQLLDCF